MNEIVSCDASVVINFLKINRIDLLESSSFLFFITGHVEEEITVYYPEQKAMLQEALDRQILKRANVETEEEMTLFVELTKSGQLGAGECAAIAIASHRTHL